MLFSFQMMLQRHYNLLPKMLLPPASSIFLLCLRRQLAKSPILLRKGKPFVDDVFKCWNKIVLSHFILYSPCCKLSVMSDCIIPGHLASFANRRASSVLVSLKPCYL